LENLRFSVIHQSFANSLTVLSRGYTDQWDISAAFEGASCSVPDKTHGLIVLYPWLSALGYRNRSLVLESEFETSLGTG
jgi:hypothetical protein